MIVYGNTLSLCGKHFTTHLTMYNRTTEIKLYYFLNAVCQDLQLKVRLISYFVITSFQGPDMATEDEYWDLWEAVKEDNIDVVHGTSQCSIFFC